MKDICKDCDLYDDCVSKECEVIEVRVPKHFEVSVKRKAIKIKDIKDDRLIRCCGCGEEKTKEHFSPSVTVSSLDGAGHCRKCNNAYTTKKRKMLAMKSYL